MEYGVRRQSFTLVELIAVIAIVGIIVGLVIPMAVNYVTTARQTADRQTLEVLNDAINRYKMQGGDLSALTAGKPYSNLLTALRTPVSWNGLSHQFLRGGGPYEQALTVDASGSGKSYQLTRYNSYDSGGGSTVLAGGVDQTGEFNIAGATYYAVAPSGYSYSAVQTSRYDTRKYNTLAAAEAALPATATTPLVINILGSWASADTTAVALSGTATSAANYILIRTIGDARHAGMWTESAYRLGRLAVSEGYCRIEGLQSSVSWSSGTGPDACFAVFANYTQFDSCIAYGSISGDADNKYGFYAQGAYGYKAYNCIAVGFYRSGATQVVGIRGPTSSGGLENTYIYNSVAINCLYGYFRSTASVYVMNSIAQGCTDGFSGITSGVNTTNNCSDVPSDAPGTNPVTDTVQFVNAGSGDYHLAPGDTVARGHGADFSAYFTNDIDGDTRTVPWSIGADQ